jgi:SAM-dependent methyltransferase
MNSSKRDRLNHLRSPTRGSNTIDRKESPAKRFFVRSRYHKYWDDKVNKVRYEEPHFREFISMLQLRKTDTILEVGAGGGRMFSAIRSAVASYVGVDLSLGGLKAEPFASASGGDLDLVVADASALPFLDSSFDKTCSFSTLFFVPDQENAIREISRVSRQATIEFANRISMGGLTCLATRCGLMIYDVIRRITGSEFAAKLASHVIGNEKAGRLVSYKELGLIQPYFPIWSWVAVNSVRRSKMVITDVRGFGGKPWWIASKVAISSKRTDLQ